MFQFTTPYLMKYACSMFLVTKILYLYYEETNGLHVLGMTSLGLGLL